VQGMGGQLALTILSAVSTNGTDLRL
jgi:hypothetical protein